MEVFALGSCSALFQPSAPRRSLAPSKNQCKPAILYSSSPPHHPRLSFWPALPASSIAFCGVADAGLAMPCPIPSLTGCPRPLASFETPSTGSGPRNSSPEHSPTPLPLPLPLLETACAILVACHYSSSTSTGSDPRLLYTFAKLSLPLVLLKISSRMLSLLLMQHRVIPLHHRV